MTVETSLARVQYDTNGTTGPFTVPFRFFEDADLQVIHTDSAGAETVLTLTTHYSVTGAGDPSGTVTTVTAYPNGGYLTILRDLDVVQETDWEDGDALPAASIENAVDRLTMIAQQVMELAGRALVFAPSDAAGTRLPAATVRANRLLAFDSAGGLTTSAAPTGTAASVLADLINTSTDTLGDKLVGMKRHIASAVATTLDEFTERPSVHLKDFGAPCDGTNDDASALNLAIAYIQSRTPTGGTIIIPELCRLNSGITITNTHGLRLLGENGAYNAGVEKSPSSIKFYGGSGANAFTLSGALATQSEFVLENIRLERMTSTGTGNGIVASAAGFSGGLKVIGSSIIGFSSGVSTLTGFAFSYQHFVHSAFYSNATWGIAAAGDNIVIDGCAISNNGPAFTSGTNAFESSAVGGAILIDQYSTNVSIGGGTHIEGHRTGIHARGVFGMKIDGCYFEAQSKASIQCFDVVGLTISANYFNPSALASDGFTPVTADSVLLSNCNAVTVADNGYAPKAYVIGLSDYRLSGCNIYYIDTAYNRAVEGAMFAMKDRYGTPNIDEDDRAANYLPAPTTLTNMTGPTLQSELGPFGVPINRYVTTVPGGYFRSDAVAGTGGTYLYFSVLIRNATKVTAIARNTGATVTITAKQITSYNKEWSVLTVGGLVPSNDNYHLYVTIDNTTLETIDLGGIVYYISATPIKKQWFSFGRRDMVTITAATYTVLTTDRDIIANRAGTVTLTLPAAADYKRRRLSVRTIQAQTVVSASSNVVPKAGGAAGTAILAATAGNWAELVSDGTNWQVMAGT